MVEEKTTETVWSGTKVGAPVFPPPTHAENTKSKEIAAKNFFMNPPPQKKYPGRLDGCNSIGFFCMGKEFSLIPRWILLPPGCPAATMRLSVMKPIFL
jgi:hypothetical protein